MAEGTEIDRAELQRRVAQLSAALGAVVAAPGALVQALPTPFFAAGRIYEVWDRARPRPLGLCVGLAGADFTVLLDESPAGFERLAERAGCRLETPLCEVFARTYLSATRSLHRPFAVLESVAEIIPRPGGEAAARVAAVQARYQDVVRGIEVSGAGPWILRLFALRGRDLVRLELTVTRTGGVSVREGVIEPRLAVAYAA